MDTTQTDPIQYPTVTFNDGTTVEVKFRCGDIIRLKKDHHIDLAEQVKLDWSESMTRSLTILSAGIAHQVKKSADDLADLIDWANLGAVTTAINEAVKKASAQISLAVNNGATVQ